MVYWLMFTTPDPVCLAPQQRSELEAMTRSTKIRAGLSRRAHLILALADGMSYEAITAKWGASPTTISRWKQRFQERGVGGLLDAPRSGRPDPLPAAMEAKILKLTKQKPPAPYTHWSVRRMAKRAGVSPATVQRVWARAGVKPHRLEWYMESPDPLFEEKAAAIIGLYLTPPENAAVFCVDEKTCIQALDRRDPVLPLTPGRAERHGFEYVRHGTLSLYAALEVATGRVKGKATERHTSLDFLQFMDEVVKGEPADREIHVILDNQSTHKTKAVQAWLEKHPNVQFHFTPTYSSWLNQVEIWFSKIERDLTARGIFTSRQDLRRKLMQYIRAHNKSCRPFHWRHSDPKRRIRTIASSETVH
jgi:transposase